MEPIINLAPTFAETVSPEAFDILSEFGPSCGVVIFKTESGLLDWTTFPRFFDRIPSLPRRLEIGASEGWESYVSDSYWHWTKTASWGKSLWSD